MVGISTLHIKAPHDVHIGAKVRAAQQGISMNRHIVNLIILDMEGSSVPRAHIQDSLHIMKQATPDEDKVLRKAAKTLEKIRERGKCKHGSPKGSCMHKEATRLKCNV